MFAEVKQHLLAWRGLKQNMTVVWGSEGVGLILNGLITSYLELNINCAVKRKYVQLLTSGAISTWSDP